MCNNYLLGPSIVDDTDCDDLKLKNIHDRYWKKFRVLQINVKYFEVLIYSFAQDYRL